MRYVGRPRLNGRWEALVRGCVPRADHDDARLAAESANSFVRSACTRTRRPRRGAPEWTSPWAASAERATATRGPRPLRNANGQIVDGDIGHFDDCLGHGSLLSMGRGMRPPCPSRTRRRASGSFDSLRVRESRSSRIGRPSRDVERRASHGEQRRPREEPAGGAAHSSKATSGLPRASLFLRSRDDAMSTWHHPLFTRDDAM